MKKLLSTAALALLVSAGAASATVTISCDRGPFPKLSIINGASKRFVDSIEKSYVITRGEATRAAEAVCADMTAVGDADKLRRLTRAVLADYRPR